MLDRTLVTTIAHALYGLDLRDAEPLDHLNLPWRGLLQGHDQHDRRWVLRLYRLPDIVAPLTATAGLLQWLEQQGYPAPVVLPALDGQLVGMFGDWAALVLSYVDGTMLDTQPFGLQRLAATLAHLHSLPLPATHPFAVSRCHPDTLEPTVRQLAAYGARLPSTHQSLAEQLREAAARLQGQLSPARCIAHGDFWFRNAIQTPSGDVVLIDWDRAGVGHPLLEFAYLLFSSHFDLRQPLVLTPSETVVDAVVRGYQQHRAVPFEEAGVLGDAMRFLLAFQLGEHAADEARVSHPDFPFVLRKLQARADAIDAIAALAVGRQANTARS
jgi:Ser/Thr protein kinase RdoA (MazF antagonist)